MTIDPQNAAALNTLPGAGYLGEVDTPWNCDIFKSQNDGEAVTKGIWAFALRPQEDESESEEEDGEEEEFVNPAGAVGNGNVNTGARSPTAASSKSKSPKSNTNLNRGGPGASPSATQTVTGRDRLDSSALSEGTEFEDSKSEANGPNANKNGSSKSSRSKLKPHPTMVILDCEGSDNLLDTREAATVASQIQAITFFLCGRGSVVFVETDRLRTQSLDELGRLLDVKLCGTDDAELYCDQNLFCVVNKETLGSSYGLDQLLSKCRRPSCSVIEAAFTPDRRHFFKIPTFFQRDSAPLPGGTVAGKSSSSTSSDSNNSNKQPGPPSLTNLVTYSDLSLPASLGILFNAIQRFTPVSPLRGGECARAVQSYLNMDALCDHLQELVLTEVRDFKRDLLPMIVRDCCGDGNLGEADKRSELGTGDTTNEVEDDISPLTKAQIASVKNSLDTEGQAQTDAVGVAASGASGSDLRSLISEGLAPVAQKLVPLDSETTVELHSLRALPEEELSKLLHSALDKRPDLLALSSSLVNAGANDPESALTNPLHLSLLQSEPKFEVSLQVILTRFARKPYVRYASVRAPQVVERISTQLKRELEAAFLREKLTFDVLRQTRRVLSVLAEVLLLRLEHDTLAELDKRVITDAVNVNNGSTVAAAAESVTSVSLTTTSTSASSSSTTPEKDDSKTTSGPGPGPNHNVNLKEREGSTSSTISNLAYSTSQYKSKMKLRSLLSHDDAILDRMLLEFDRHTVVLRVQSEKWDDHEPVSSAEVQTGAQS